MPDAWDDGLVPLSREFPMPPALLIVVLAAGWVLATLTVIVFFMGASRSHRAEREHWAAAASTGHRPAGERPDRPQLP
jgi:hypothetical protein